MSVQIACTACNARFNVNESTIGKRVKCPKCQTVFQAAAAGGAAPRQAPAAGGFQQGAPPQPQRGGGGFAPPPPSGNYGAPNVAQGGGSWGTATTGLRLVLISVIAFLVMVVIMGGYLLVSPSGGNPMDAIVGGGILFMVVGCMALVFGILWFVGLCLCCTSPYPPAKSRAKIAMFTIIASVVVSILGSVVSMVMLGGAVQQAAQMPQGGFPQGGFQFDKDFPKGFQMEKDFPKGFQMDKDFPKGFNMPPNAQRAAQQGMGAVIVMLIINVIIGILSLVAFIFWMMYFMAVGDYFRAPALKTQAIISLILQILGPVLFYGLLFLTPFIVSSPSTAVRLIGVWLLLVFGAVLGQYMMMLFKAIGVMKRGSAA